MGCSTLTNREVFPPGRETVQQVYDRHFQLDSAYSLDVARRRLARQHLLNASGGTAASDDRFTRDAVRELQTLFPPLANRELAMYVFPHLATDGLYPVPGYITTFWLYEGHPYALPGERVVFPP
jgi:conjugative transfer region lipoprotein (TIGR03751 family)